MASNNTQTPVETLIDHLNTTEITININFIKSRQLMDNSLCLIGELKSELRKHTECSHTTSTNNTKYTLLSLDRLTDTLFNSDYYNIVKNTVKNKTTPIIIASCDGGVKSLRSIIYLVASFSFGQTSNLYGSTGVSQSVDLTHSELVAVFDLLSQALINHLDKITVVIDNQAAMSIAAYALTTTP